MWTRISLCCKGQQMQRRPCMHTAMLKLVNAHHPMQTPAIWLWATFEEAQQMQRRPCMHISMLDLVNARHLRKVLPSDCVIMQAAKDRCILTQPSYSTSTAKTTPPPKLDPRLGDKRLPQTAHLPHNSSKAQTCFWAGSLQGATWAYTTCIVAISR